MTPNQRRIAVAVLQDRFGVSQRKACHVLGQHRSTQRYCLHHSGEQVFLRQRLRVIAVKFPRY